MILLYDIFLVLLFIPTALLLLVRYRKRARTEFFYRFGERLGRWDYDLIRAGEKPILWFHCASLGEVRAIEPLLRELSGYRLILTTLTPSGRDYAARNRIADFVYLAPLDFSVIVKRVIARAKPAALVLVETEFWPGHISSAFRSGVKLLLINGRLSNHSYKYYNFFKPLFSYYLVRLGVLGARSQEDAERFIRLGYPRERVVMTGNIKYDRPAAVSTATRETLGLSGSDLLFVAGSTRSGEEEILLDAWLKLREKHSRLKLAIAPRHLDRVADILELMLHRKITCTLYSSHPQGGYDCLLIDTFGDLQKFYAVCDVAFVGGSLVDKGGQNPIEPASFSKPVVFGRHMSNFLTEARVLEGTGGGFRVGTPQDLLTVLDGLLSDPARKHDAGKKALEAVESQKGALTKTKELIEAVVRGN